MIPVLQPADRTLPPIEVRPPRTDDQGSPSDVTPTEPPTTAPPTTAPPTTAPPTTAPSDDEPSPFDLPPVIPSLSHQSFGGGPDYSGLNSVTRGATSLFEQPRLGSVVGTREIQEKQATDLFRALQNEVGVLMQATGRGQSSPFLRGVTGQQVLILVDGIRMNNSTFRAGPNQYFNLVDPGQVERIEVLRGSGSVPWGNGAIGGVINIVTRGADPTLGHYGGQSFRQTFSSADSGWYGRGNLEGWVGSSGLFAGGSFLNVHDLDIGGGRGRQPFTDYQQYAGDVKYNLQVDAEQMVTVSLSHFEQEDLPRSDRFAPFVFNRPGNTPRPTFFDPQQRDLAYVRWEGLADPNLFVDAFSVTASYTRNKEGLRELRSPTQLDFGEFTNDVFGFTLSLQKDLDGAGSVRYGGEYYYEDIDARRRRFNPNTGLPTAVQPVPQYPDDSRADHAGAFVQWEVALTSQLSAHAGARYENANLSATPRIGGNDIHFARTYQDWIAGAGLTYRVCDGWELVGGVYEGYRTPTIDDLTANATFQQNVQQDVVQASLNVQPEHSYTYEIGTKFDCDGTEFEAYQWWMQIEDYIARTVIGPNVILGNHDAYLYGTEFRARQRLACGWSAYGNFAYTHGDDLTDHRPVSRIPPMQAIVGGVWRDDEDRQYVDCYAWLVQRQGRYNPVNLTDSRFWVDGFPATPGYVTLNVRAGTLLDDAGTHRVSLLLENLTDTYYRVLGSGVDGTGFNAIVSYEFRR